MKELRDIIIGLSIEYKGDFDKVYDCICKSVRPSKIVRKEDLPHPAITVIDDDYPSVFKKANVPPIVFYYEGNLKLLDNTEVPLRAFTLDDGTRMFNTLYPIETNGCLEFEWIICCENIEKVDVMVEHMRSKGIPMKNYCK